VRETLVQLHSALQEHSALQASRLEASNRLWLRNGYFIGGDDVHSDVTWGPGIRVISGVAQRDPDVPSGDPPVWIPDEGGLPDRPWQQGDRVLNPYPTTTVPYAGWICVTSPSPQLPTQKQRDKGVWKPFGRIEQI